MKARFFAIAALVLGLASCQQDFAPDAEYAGGEVNVQLSVSAPELIGATRAGKNGEIDNQKALNSAFGAIDYLDGNGLGKDAKQVNWDDVDIRYTMEVYDVADFSKPIKDRQEIIKDRYETVQFEVRLIPNRNYQFVVFADFVDQATGEALRHEIGETLNDITLINEAINDEVADCYYKSWEFEPTNNTSNQTEAILTRPYAKVRVIATDLHELNLNVNPETIDVVYDAVLPTSFNAVTGSIKGDNTTKKFSYAYISEIRKYRANHVYNADYDAKVDEKTGRASHITLFTDYILAEDEQNSIHFKMTVSDKIGPIKVVDFNTEIPVQRNFLTTIIGDVLTTNNKVDITINDNFDGYFVKNANFASNREELQYALDNAVEGDNVIVVSGNIEGDVTVDQQEGKNIVIDGSNYKFNGSIYVKGNSRYTAETVTIKNFNFEAAEDVAIDFIQQNSQAAPDRYAHNVTIENCTFKGGANAVATKFRQSHNITIKDCTVLSGHSLAQLNGCDNVVIENVVVNAGRGVSYSTSTNNIVKNSTFNVESYGLRADGNDERTLDIENVTISAQFPVIVRKAKGNYTVNFAGTNELTAPGYQVVFTNGADDAMFVEPTGNFTLTGAEDFIVFPGDKAYAYDAAWLQNLLDNTVEGENTINLAANIEGNVNVSELAGTTTTINGNGYKYDGTFYIIGKSAYADATTVFENINFETANALEAFIYANTINGDTSTRYPDNVTIKNCTFAATDAAFEAIAAAKFWSLKGNLIVENCSANGLHSLLQLTSCGEANVTVDKATVENCKNGISLQYAGNTVIKNSNITAREYGVRANGCEANTSIENTTITAVKPVIVRNMKEGNNYALNFNAATLNTTGYQVVFTTKSDDATFVAPAEGTYTLTGADNFRVFPRDAANNNFIYTTEEFKAAINAKTSVITLQPGKYEGAFKPAVATTIKSADPNNKAVIAGRIDFDKDCVVENIKFDVTSDSAAKKVFSGTNYQYPSTANIYAAAVTFEGCEFTSDIATGVCGINYGAHAAGKELKVNNCTFKGDFYAIRTRTLFEITNCVFDVYTSAGTLAAVWTWGNGNSGANKVTFTGNTNANANQIYGVQMTASTYTYDNLVVNVQNNTGFYALEYSVNLARNFNGTTFVEGSETFAF